MIYDCAQCEDKGYYVRVKTVVDDAFRGDTRTEERMWYCSCKKGWELNSHYKREPS